jgi:hypothetical protein
MAASRSPKRGTTGIPRGALLEALRARFEAHPHRHVGVTWAEVAARIERHPTALRALQAMEATGGEPDVVARDKKSGRLTFCDCAPDSPAGRRSACYDGKAREGRREARPATSAVEMAADMGIELLTEDGYVELQALEPFDTKTSSWIATPADVRARGGALFGDRRFGRVFVYHNSAQSYYAARGFRGSLRV